MTIGTDAPDGLGSTVRPGSLSDLISVEAVDPQDPDAAAPTSATFVGRPTNGPYGRMFGGQLIGQAAMAATATIGTPGRVAHSLHALFLRPGRVDLPVRYEVETLRDGRAFSGRLVRASQDGRLVLTATVSFHERGEGLSHAVTPLAGYPDPELLESDAPSFLDGHLLSHRAFVDVRRVPPSDDPGRPRAGQAVWLRARDPGGARSPGSGDARSRSDALDRAVLAMSTDFTTLETVLRGHNLTTDSSGFTLASLDHAIWWHGASGLDDWVLYVQESPWAGEERGLVSGRVFDRAGVLLASVVQEGLFRRADHSGGAGA